MLCDFLLGFCFLPKIPVREENLEISDKNRFCSTKMAKLVPIGTIGEACVQLFGANDGQENHTNHCVPVHRYSSPFCSNNPLPVLHPSIDGDGG